jgi:Skp family chaperone for outer membrane proteins
MRFFVRGAAYSVAALMVAAAGHAQTEPTAAGSNLPPTGTPMVYVNTLAILPVAPGANDAQVSFQQELTGYEDEMRALGAEIDSLVSTYRRQESLLDQGAKEQRQQEILLKQQAARERQIELEQISEERRQTLLEPILDHVREVIEEIRAANQYAIVFDVAEAGVVAADPGLDITAAVLERLGVSPDATAAVDPGR